MLNRDVGSPSGSTYHVMKRVLFIDDEPMFLQGLKSALYPRRKDWDMHFAHGGAKGIELLNASHFDLLVTDLRMPGVDGTTVLARARTDSPDTVRIVLSGYADEVQSLRLVSLVHRYLSKPCEPKRLEECIDRCFGTQALIQSGAMRTRLGSIGALPPMPHTFAALQAALANPAVDSRKVAAIIQKDPGISAKVLQVCNSAFFRLPRRVSSIQQAVSYLGLSSVRSLVLAAEVFKPGAALPPALDIERLQRHALNVAAIARLLAADRPWADDAFLAGLLHDIGFLLLGRQFPVEMQRALESAAKGMPLADAEHENMGLDHGAAGGYLLGLWGLPFEIVEAVAHHEAPARVTAGSFDMLGAVALAHALLDKSRPADVPSYETSAMIQNDDYLRTIGVSESWDSLLQRTGSLLDTEQAA